MLGSTTLHGWTESAVYIESKGSETNLEGATSAKITLEREFRAAGLYPKMNIDVSMGNIGDMEYSVQMSELKTPQVESSDLLDILSQYPKGISARALAKEMEMSRDKVLNMVKQSGGRVVIIKGGKGKSDIIKLNSESEGGDK